MPEKMRKTKKKLAKKDFDCAMRERAKERYLVAGEDAGVPSLRLVAGVDVAGEDAERNRSRRRLWLFFAIFSLSLFAFCFFFPFYTCRTRRGRVFLCGNHSATDSYESVIFHSRRARRLVFCAKRNDYRGYAKERFFSISHNKLNH